jgi:hypothetical protein
MSKKRMKPPSPKKEEGGRREGSSVMFLPPQVLPVRTPPETVGVRDSVGHYSLRFIPITVITSSETQPTLRPSFFRRIPEKDLELQEQSIPSIPQSCR